MLHVNQTILEGYNTVSCVKSSLMGLEFQLNSKPSSGFMLMELVMGICIFVAMLFVAYSYVGMSLYWKSYVKHHNAVIDTIVSICEGGLRDANVKVHSEQYIPDFVRAQVGWHDITIPSVHVVSISQSWGENEAHSIEIQTAD